MTSEYIVKINRMRMDRGTWVIDGMSDPMILHEGGAFDEALEFFSEYKGEAKDVYLTERSCGNFNMLRGGYAVVLERDDVDENGDYIGCEILEMESYTVDDYKKDLDCSDFDVSSVLADADKSKGGPSEIAREAITSCGRGEESLTETDVRTKHKTK